jgi:hypothetical protein
VGAAAADVGEPHREALGDLAVHGEVPLVGAGPLVAVERAVPDALTVAEVGLDEGRRGEVLGEAILQIEGRLQSAQ